MRARFFVPAILAWVPVATIAADQAGANSPAPSAKVTPAPASTAAPTERKEPTPLVYDELALTDGRTLTKVVVKTYDARGDRFLLLAAGKAVMLPANQIPEPLRDRLKRAAPQAGGSTSSSLAPPPKPVVIQPQPFPTMSGLPTAPAPAPATPAPALAAANQLKQATVTRANQYYLSEYVAGSTGARVSSVQIETDEPEQIAGWSNRYRVQGRATLKVYVGRGYRDSWSTFEAVLEIINGSPRVLDFAPKS